MNVSQEEFRSGFIAVIGKPNVGKSTLVNALVGEKIAIVSPRPQTTRNKIMGIVNMDQAQLILLDTPGIHFSRTKLGNYMNNSVQDALKGIDGLAIMMDATNIRASDQQIAGDYSKTNIPCFLLLNKIDLLHPQDLLEIIQRFSEFPFKAIIPISARKGDGLDTLQKEFNLILPKGPKYFPDDMITDQPERVICAELIREKALLFLKEEVPHGIGIEILSIEKMNNQFTQIHATIYCDKESHKRIIIGKNGQMLQKIGSAARLEIETLLGTHINLTLWVKIKPNWRDSEFDLRTLGYTEEK